MRSRTIYRPARMRVGIHLPQYGRAAGADAVVRVARAARGLGFADVWVSDHVVHPARQDYPSPYLLRPADDARWAAAATRPRRARDERARAPAAHPLWLANALGQPRPLERRPAHDRASAWAGPSASSPRSVRASTTAGSAPTRSSISCARAGATTRRPSTATHYSARRDPRAPEARRTTSRSGSAARASRRTAARSSGATASRRSGWTPTGRGRRWARIRRDRPDPSFTISLRTGWDPQGMEPDNHPRGARRVRERPASSTSSRRRGATTSTTGSARWSSSPSWSSRAGGR